jgi:hypothetical protein
MKKKHADDGYIIVVIFLSFYWFCQGLIGSVLVKWKIKTRMSNTNESVGGYK